MQLVVNQIVVGNVIMSRQVQGQAANPARCAAVLLNRLCSQIQLKGTSNNRFSSQSRKRKNCEELNENQFTELTCKI
jgi:hypothetical protein